MNSDICILAEKHILDSSLWQDEDTVLFLLLSSWFYIIAVTDHAISPFAQLVLHDHRHLAPLDLPWLNVEWFYFYATLRVVLNILVVYFYLCYRMVGPPNQLPFVN